MPAAPVQEQTPTLGPLGVETQRVGDQGYDSAGDPVGGSPSVTKAVVTKTAPASSGGSSATTDTPPVRTGPTPRVNPDTYTADYSDSGLTSAQKNSGAPVNPNDNVDQQFKDQLQNMTDSIDSAYADKTKVQTDVNNAADARTRVLNEKGGNIDSGTGSAALSKSEQLGADKLKSISDDHSAKILSAINSVDALKEKMKEYDTSQGRLDATTAQNLKVANAKTATDTLTSLAKANVDLTKLQTDRPDPNGPSSFDTLGKALGLTPLELTAKYNSLKSSPINYNYITDKDGYTYGYGLDPVTRQLVETPKQKIEGLQPGDTLTETKTGELVIKTQAGSYKPAVIPKAPVQKSITDGKLSTNSDEIGSGSSLLQTGGIVNGTTYKSSAENGGFADPSLYNLMYQQWRTKGGTPNGFIKYYPPAKYVNPKNTKGLPAFLVPKGGAAAASTSTGA